MNERVRIVDQTGRPSWVPAEVAASIQQRIEAARRQRTPDCAEYVHWGVYGELLLALPLLLLVILWVEWVQWSTS